MDNRRSSRMILWFQPRQTCRTRRPNLSRPLPPPAAAPASGKRPFPLRWIALLGVLVLIAIGAGSAYGGYQSGISQRTAAGATQAAAQVQEQFELGIQDIEARRFDLARQRFEYVIQVDPSYPGVTEKLAVVLLSMQSTATPTVAPTPTVTPTPDLRNVEERFSQAQAVVWQTAIGPPPLRPCSPCAKSPRTHQPVDVDGMLYIAYRNRGADKILRDGDLEGGIFDLTEAEQIGPLDTDFKKLPDLGIVCIKPEPASGSLTGLRRCITLHRLPRRCPTCGTAPAGQRPSACSWRWSVTATSWRRTAIFARQ